MDRQSMGSVVKLELGAGDERNKGRQERDGEVFGWGEGKEGGGTREGWLLVALA